MLKLLTKPSCNNKYTRYCFLFPLRYYYSRIFSELNIGHILLNKYQILKIIQSQLDYF